MGATALDSRRIVLTRPTAGRLADLLRGLGAFVEHVPLIEIGDAADGGAALTAALGQLDSFDWLVVTSANGARRLGAVARASAVKVAAVGAVTAATVSALTGRPVDLVPAEQNTDGLLAEFPRTPSSILLAQGNLAGSDLADGLRSIGHQVTTVEAYVTRHRTLSGDERDALHSADVVVLSSGSAVDAWLAAERAIGAAIVTIGPKTAAVAAKRGLRIAAVSASPSDDDIVNAVAGVLRGRAARRARPM